MEGTVLAAGLLSLLLGISAVVLLVGLLHKTPHGPLVGIPLALGLSAALALFFYGVALLSSASVASVNMIGYIFTVLFASALVLAAPMVLATHTFPRHGRMSAALLALTVLVLATMALVMYWEGGSVLGFVTPPLFVLGAILALVTPGYKHHRTHSVVYALLLLLSAFFFFAALFTCLGDAGRRDWLWGVALLIHALNVAFYVRALPPPSATAVTTPKNAAQME